MTRMPRRATAVATALATALTTALVVMLAPTPSVSAPADRFPTRFALPDGFLPEGIAIAPGKTAFFGSRADGDIYAVDLRTGQGTTISQGPGTASVGLKSDRRGRLFVAGGTAGDARVVATDDGTVLRSYQLATGASFVNDVLLTKPMAWFTDSFNARLYGLPLTRSGPQGGRLPEAADVVTLPLGGAWVQGSGFGANGICDTPDKRALLVIHSASGLLYRVDPGSGRASVVDLNGAALTAGDGLLRHGRTLYVVRNQLNQVAVVMLDRTGATGAVTRIITSPDFDIPTTVGRFGHRLYLPNARFSTPATPSTPYWVTQVPAR